MATQRIEQIMGMIQNYAIQAIRTEYYKKFVNEGDGLADYTEQVLFRTVQFDKIREAIIDLTWSVNK